MTHRPKSPCPVCTQAISKQGLTAHLRYKHPNYDAAASTRRPPTSVSPAAFLELERWKEGFMDGVLAGLRKAG